jgi:hypothetical protein
MVRAVPAAGLVAVLLLLAPAVKAQQAAPQSTSKPSPQAQSQPQAPPPPTAEGMGVSLKSVRRQAMPPPATERQSGTGLRYDFFVDVFGQRPAINFFKDFDLSTKGAVRYGSVTHQELLNAVTPYGFHIYSGAVDLLPKKK